LVRYYDQAISGVKANKLHNAQAFESSQLPITQLNRYQITDNR